MNSSDESHYRDGNSLAGTFAETLGLDVSTTVLTCAGCGRGGPIAESHVYDRGPGAVVRCTNCTQIVARVVRTPTELWLDLRGSSSWRIPVQIES